MSDPHEWQLKVFGDIMHAVRVRLGYTDCFVEFRVYPLFCVPDDEKVLFCGETSEYEEDIDKAHCSIHGDVKWDGCMNFASNPKCMVHACGPDSMRNISEALSRVFGLAKEIMPNASF